MEFDSSHESREKEEKFTQEEIAMGEPLPFDRIVTAEGGRHNPGNVEAATNYVRWCLERGGKWVINNEKTQRTEYLYVKNLSQEKTSNVWALKRKHSNVTRSRNLSRSASHISDRCHEKT
jgi:hypothetical protein